MKMQLVLEGDDLDCIIKEAESFLKRACFADKPEDVSEEKSPPAKKTAKKEKEVEEETDEEFSLGDEKDEKELTLKSDIIPALQAYAREHSREDAAKILKKFKVKAVHDLKAEDYPAVMKALV